MKNLQERYTKLKMKKENNKFYKFTTSIAVFLFKILYRPKVIGKENIPKDEALIFAGNHKHAFDPLLVIMSTKRIVHYMAKNELFKGIIRTNIWQNRIN